MAGNSACSSVASCLSTSWAARRPPIFMAQGARPRAGNFATLGAMPPPLLLSRRFAPLFCLPVLRGIQRQFSQDRAGVPDLVPLRRGRRGGVDHAGERDFHRALFLPIRARRRAGRPLRQSARRAMGEICRDLGRRRRGRRLRARLVADPLYARCSGSACSASLFGPIKYGILPDHLRREELPAGNALVEGATFIAILAGTIVGGLAARGGDVAPFAALVMGFALACWLSALLIPPSGEGAPQLKLSDQYRRLDRGHDPPFARRSPAVVGRHGDELVLARRHRRAGAAAAADQDADRRQRRHRHRLSCAVLDCGRRRLRARGGARARPHRAQDHVRRRRAARPVRARSWDCDLWRTSRAAAADAGAVFASALGIRAAIDLAGMAVAGGLFIVPTFAAVQAWAGAAYRAPARSRRSMSSTLPS